MIAQIGEPELPLAIMHPVHDKRSSVGYYDTGQEQSRYFPASTTSLMIDNALIKSVYVSSTSAAMLRV